MLTSLSATIHRYGLVDIGGIWFLHQEEGGFNPMTSIESPMKVKPLVKRMTCPHSIRLPETEPEGYSDLPPTELVSAFLPLPKKRTVLISNDLPILSDLCRLSSPCRPIVYPVWGLPKRTFRDEMSITNIAPMVMVGVNSTHTALVNDLLSVARFGDRTLILVGDSTVVLPRCVEEVRYEGEVLDGNPNEIGGWAVKQFMMGAYHGN